MFAGSSQRWGHQNMSTAALDAAHKAALDTLLLGLPGVVGAPMAGLTAYFVNKRMFACISNGGVGLRLPAAVATELQFSRADVSAFQPKGLASTREWVQINRSDSADYAKDLEILKASLEFVRAARQ